MLQNRIRIIGGQWRGRQIAFNPDTSIRPTPDRVRETLFNWLMGQIAEARCLDLFAGSGILGLEALSRGAAFVCSLEKSPAALNGLKEALQQLKVETNRYRTVQDDVPTWLAKAPATHQPTLQPFDIIFVDPPYAANLGGPCLRLIKQHGWLAANGIIYLESDKPLTDIIAAEGFGIHREKKAGSVHSYLVKPAT